MRLVLFCPSVAGREGEDLGSGERGEEGGIGKVTGDIMEIGGYFFFFLPIFFVFFAYFWMVLYAIFAYFSTI